MTFLAGVVRHDRRAVPDEWISRLGLAGAGGERLCHSSTDNGDAVFLASGDALRMSGEGKLLLCDARLDAPMGFTGEMPLETSDTDRVANGYRLEGEAWFNDLVGDFALATWHQPARRLRLFRSALGTRPLFYTMHEGVFAFASALRALLALPFVDSALDDGALCRLLSFDGTAPANETFYRAIRRLPGAHSLTLDEDRVSIEPLSGQWPANVPSIVGRGTDPADMVRDLLTAAVECRIAAGETVAVHLSGGLDSSAIACIAARHLKRDGRRLLALCSVLPEGHTGPERDERPFIKAVLAQEDNIDPVWVDMPLDRDPFSALPHWFDCLAEPVHSNVTHVEERLAEIGRARGVDVVLSGFAGDLFVSASGLPAPAALVMRGRWRDAARELWRLGSTGDISWPQLIRWQLLGPMRRRFWPDRKRVDRGCANPGLVDRVARAEGRRPVSSVAAMAGATPHESMRFILAPGRLERLPPVIRQVFVERFTQDIRFPLLDPHLIAFILSLEEEDLHFDGVPRGLMRRAMTGILPEAVRLRPDKGPPFDPALATRCARMKPVLRQWMETAPPICWDYVDKMRFAAALEAVEPAGRAGWRRDMFSVLLLGGRVAKFIDWHQRGGSEAWK